MKSAQTLSELRKALRVAASPSIAKNLRWFFKTGPGQYGEGDKFLGVKVPQIRAITRSYETLPLKDIEKLLNSPWHEERLAALLLLVHQYDQAGQKTKKAIYSFYLRSAAKINNWDLVDLSAPNIVGDFLLNRSRKQLYTFAKSKNLWKRRIAIVSTLTFIRNNDFEDTLAISEILLNDSHDLIHKACGWMLREVYKRSPKTLEAFLKKYAVSMPRTMLRYSIERMPEKKRKAWLKNTK